MEKLTEMYNEWNKWLDSLDQDSWMSFRKWVWTYKMPNLSEATNSEVDDWIAKECNILKHEIYKITNSL